MKRKIDRKLKLKFETVSNLNDVKGGIGGETFNPTNCESDCLSCPTESTPQMSGCYTQCGGCPGGGGGDKWLSENPAVCTL